MGVCVDPAFKSDGGSWVHVSDPVSPGYTYSHWSQILDGLRLGEAHVTVGTMPIDMLRVHLDAFGYGISARVHGELLALIEFCEANGYTHIGWA